MPRTGSIEYIIDDRGRKKSVVMSYRTYLRLLEDIADLRAIAERRDQTPEDLESVIADMKNAGRV
ncbi:MAG: hypothetical protein Q7N50_14150 [Armatimonadota bacterium]|nr:hypothetical protein [Armatimonadota bacterium]